MVLEFRNGLIIHLMRENTFRDLSMERENSHGLMGQSMRVIFKRI